MLTERWAKPPRCDTSSCAEVRYLEETDTVEMRDSDVPGMIVSLSREDWTKFVQGAKAGFYDL